MGKKSSVGKKIFKIIGLIIFILLFAFLCHTIRNFVIIRDLQKKISKYSDSTNYRLTINRTEPNGNTQVTDYYKKDNKQAAFLERTDNGETTKISMYDNGERVDMFTETKDSKTAKLDTGGLISVQIYNMFEAPNFLITLFYSAVSKISNVKVDGKEYLAATNTYYIDVLHDAEGTEAVLIDKDTGLIVGNYNSEYDVKRTYEFDNVIDAIFTEPDIGLYTIENN